MFKLRKSTTTCFIDVICCAFVSCIPSDGLFFSVFLGSGFCPGESLFVLGIFSIFPMIYCWGKSKNVKKTFLFSRQTTEQQGPSNWENILLMWSRHVLTFFDFSDLLAFGAFVKLLEHFQLNPDRYFSFCKDGDLESGYHNCIRGKLELLPCDCQPPPASQLQFTSMFVQMGIIHVVKTLKEFN